MPISSVRICRGRNGRALQAAQSSIFPFLFPSYNLALPIPLFPQMSNQSYDISSWSHVSRQQSINQTFPSIHSSTQLVISFLCLTTASNGLTISFNKSSGIQINSTRSSRSYHFRHHRRASNYIRRNSYPSQFLRHCFRIASKSQEPRLGS